MPRRTYTEEEVAALLKRAAELEALRRSSVNSDDTGLTLEEIESIAIEAGLDPENLRIAAGELDRPEIVRSPTTHAVVRGPVIFAERWVNGELTDEVVEEVVAELRHQHDSQAGRMWGSTEYGRSTVQTIGRSVEWTHTDLMGMYDTKVLLQPRDGKIRVRVSVHSSYGGSWETARYWSWIIGSAIAIPIGLIMATAAGSVLIGVATIVGGFALGVPLLYKWYEGYKKKYMAKVETLSSDLIRLLHSFQPAKNKTRAKVDEPLLDDLDVGESQETRGRYRQKIR